MPNLTLYYTPSCPFCKKVTDFMQKNDIQIKMVDRDFSPQDRKALIDIGGKPQVPCLLIDGKAMYESDDIISWLATHLVEGEGK